jgi:TPR repeat protein
MSWLAKLFEREPPAEQRLADALVAWNAQDYGVALDLWAPLAQAGLARAQSNMGAAFLEGRGVERDLEKAAAWLRRAAEQGDAGGQRNLALCYYEAGACRRTRPKLRSGTNGLPNRTTPTRRTCCRG